MPDQQPFTVIILAGGKSSRMGADKGLTAFRGQALVQHVTGTANTVTGNIVIITANPSYRQFGWPCIRDEYPGKGPLGGIYTGLAFSRTKKNLILGCDMPFLSAKLLSELIGSAGGEDVLLTEHKGLAEPLCSVYDTNCAGHIRLLLEQNQLKITDALAGLKTRVISFDGEEWFRGNEFANINSVEELKKYND